MPRIYLDHAATTPILPEARAAMAEASGRWANPSSPHAEGRAARAALEEARGIVADALGWRHDVIFTSGASEAIGIAAWRARIAGRAIGATEHDIVPSSMPDATVIGVDNRGLVDPEALSTLLASGPALVAIQQANNETGVLQPCEAIGEAIRARGSLWLADCAQSAGKIDLPDADFIAVSAHKFGGPPGIGALLVKDLATLEASGGQERGYRRGTQDMPSAAGFAAALATRKAHNAMPRLSELRARLDDGVRLAGGVVIASEAPRLATIGAIALPGVSAASLVVQLDLAGFAVSAGSACSSGSMRPSRVLEALGVAPEIAASTTAEDVEAFLETFAAIAQRRQAA